VDRAAVVVRNMVWSGIGPPEYPKFPVTKGLTGAAIAERRIVNVEDVSADTRYLVALSSTRSEIIVPVFDRDGTNVPGHNRRRKRKAECIRCGNPGSPSGLLGSSTATVGSSKSTSFCKAINLRRRLLGEVIWESGQKPACWKLLQLGVESASRTFATANSCGQD